MSILKRAEIQWKLLASYTPAQNKITEHTYYLIFNSVKSIIIAIKLLKSLWIEFIKTICYIHNQLSKKKEPSIYKMIKNHKSDLTHLCTLKCKVFITFLKEWRDLKLNARS